MRVDFCTGIGTGHWALAAQSAVAFGLVDGRVDGWGDG